MHWNFFNIDRIFFTLPKIQNKNKIKNKKGERGGENRVLGVSEENHHS